MKSYSSCCNDRCAAGCGSQGSNCNTCGVGKYGDYVNRNGICEVKTACKVGISRRVTTLMRALTLKTPNPHNLKNSDPQ